MAVPLSPLSESILNVQLPSSRDQSALNSPKAVKANIPAMQDQETVWDEGPSSPFQSFLQTEVSVEQLARRIASKTAHEQTSPEKNLPAESTDMADELGITDATSFAIAEDSTSTMPSSENSPSNVILGTFHSNRTPPAKTAQAVQCISYEEDTTIKTQFSYKTCEERTVHAEGSAFADVTTLTMDGDANIDDTCFSTFSEIPNADMTAFAKLGQRSPTKQILYERQTPRPTSQRTPGTARTRQMGSSPRSSSPTPRRGPSVPYVDSNDTTNLLIDFTQQFEALSTGPTQGAGRSPTRRASKGGHLLNYLAAQRSPQKAGSGAGAAAAAPPSSTPKKNLLNLLDFELPPAPTPRSVPSITIRELESLKSTYASEISGLKATLSGREAEVAALKRSVADAERRVGEAAEALREARDAAECVRREKDEWVRRGRDFEDVLRKVRDEVLAGERERAELDERVRDAELRADEAEKRAVEAATKIVTAPAGGEHGTGEGAAPLFTAEQVQKQIDEKVHALSTELHAIYKKKHITKVAGLKKGFESKTKEKTAELQARVDELETRNDELQAKIDGTLSGKVILSGLAGASMEEKEKTKEQSALIERQKAELAGKEEELRTAKQEFAGLIKELERERIEKGELVAAVDEMLSLQSDMSTLTPAAANSAVEDFKKSIGLGVSRPSGLRGPGFGTQGPLASQHQQSRIGVPAGLNRSTSGGKSRMMSNIERMGGRAVD